MTIRAVVAYFMFMCTLRTGAEEAAPIAAEAVGGKGAGEAAAGVGADAAAGDSIAASVGADTAIGGGEAVGAGAAPDIGGGLDGPAVPEGGGAPAPDIGGGLDGPAVPETGGAGVGVGDTTYTAADGLADGQPGSVDVTVEPDGPVGGETGGVDLSGFNAQSAGLDASTNAEAGGIFSGGSGGGGSDMIGEDVATGSGASTAETVAAEKAFSEGAKAAGGGGVQSALDKLLKYGPLALSAGNLINQRSAINKFAGAGQGGTPATLSQIGAPQTAVGQKILADFQNGTLNPADSAAIDRWEQQALAQMKQFYANAHISDSSQATQAAADISKKAEEMRAQARQNLLTTGLSALNVTDGNQRAAIQAEMQADASARAASLKFMDSYGQWLANLPKLTGTASSSST